MKIMSCAAHAPCIALLICLAASLTYAQEHTLEVNPSEDQVKQLERRWLAADGKGDAAALSRIISDGFIGSSFDGRLLTKADIIPDGNGPGGFAGATPGETNVRIFGDTGVLIGVINTAGSPAKPIRVTLVCQKSPQGWLIIAAQLTQTH